MAIELRKALSLFERGVVNWISVEVACFDMAAQVGATATIAMLPPAMVERLRVSKYVVDPPSGKIFPIQAANYLVPGTESESKEDSRFLGAQLLHDHFYPKDLSETGDL